jgi:hypothetical protein
VRCSIWEGYEHSARKAPRVAFCNFLARLTPYLRSSPLMPNELYLAHADEVRRRNPIIKAAIIQRVMKVPRGGDYDVEPPLLAKLCSVAK